MHNKRTGPDYLDHANAPKKKRKSTEGGYQSPDGKFYPGMKPQYQEPPKRTRATAVLPKAKPSKRRRATAVLKKKK